MQEQAPMPSLCDSDLLSLNRFRYHASGQNPFALKEPTDSWERWEVLRGEYAQKDPGARGRVQRGLREQGTIPTDDDVGAVLKAD